jgi:acyl-CoA hydrolase
MMEMMNSSNMIVGGKMVEVLDLTAHIVCKYKGNV